MSYTSVKLKYYNGGQYNKSVVLHKTEQDFDRFCKMIRAGQFIPPARKQAYQKNLDNLIIWLDAQYCDTGIFLNNVFENMFISGVDLQNLISCLMKDNTTDKDFMALELV